jgi:hypothetical protein
VNRLSGSRVGIALIRPLLGAIRARHRMQTLEAVPAGTRWAIRGVVNPTSQQNSAKEVDPGGGAAGAGGSGTQADPFLIDWPKRPLANYAPVWLVPAATAGGQEYTQARLRNMPGAVEFTPASRRALFGGPTIGVATGYRTRVNKVFGPAPHSRGSTPQLDAYKRLFSRHGYNRVRGDAEGTTDADHVSELQMVGPTGDTFDNLWPLNLSENRSSGSTLSNTRVTLPNGTSTTIRQLPGPNYYFKIRRFLR